MGKPAQIFMPPNTLKEKIDAAGGLDGDALKRAESALETMKANFDHWMLQDVAKLISARNSFEEDRTENTLSTFYLTAHDLKGHGGLFEYPIVARVAASLCLLIDIEGNGKALPMRLIDAHVDAIKAVVQHQIKDSANPTACALADELEKKVADYQQ